MPPLVPVVKILKKIWGNRENLGETGFKVLRDLTVKSANFSALATSDIKISQFFCEVDKPTKLVRLMKKIIITEEKGRKMTFFNENSPYLSPNFIRGSTVIVFPHNVQL